MPIWLAPIIAWFSHNLARFLGVVAIGAIIIGTPLTVYHHITEKAYNNGYKSGYSQALTDHPQIVGNNNTIVTNGKEPFFLLKIWKLRLGI